MVKEPLSDTCGNRRLTNPAPVLRNLLVISTDGSVHSARFDGVVDTGSGISFVPLDVCTALYKVPYDFGQIRAYNGLESLQPLYRVYIRVSGLSGDVELTVGGIATKKDIILGRDFLAKMFLLVNFDTSKWWLEDRLSWEKFLAKVTCDIPA